MLLRAWLTFALIFASALCLAQQEKTRQRISIQIGLVSVSIGTGKEVIISQLSKHYVLRMDPITPSPKAESWIVLSGKNSNVTLGGITVVSGVVTGAWNSGPPQGTDYTAPELAELVYKIAGKFSADGNNRACEISTGSSVQAPGPDHLEFRSTTFQCGPRRMEIMLMWQSGQSWVQVNEYIGD
jgi:hypothetical protein